MAKCGGMKLCSSRTTPRTFIPSPLQIPNDSATPPPNHFPKAFGYHPGMSTVVRTSPARPCRRPGPRAGFSLVELLVIVAIVVILFSIFVPYAMKMREANRRGQCADNLRAIGFALAQYAGPNGHYYPRVAFDPTRP